MTAEELRKRVDAIALDVEALVVELTGIREELDASGELMPSMLGYRLAVIVARVDHAAAEIVLQQSRRLEVEGQRSIDELLEEGELVGDRIDSSAT